MKYFFHALDPDGSALWENFWIRIHMEADADPDPFGGRRIQDLNQ